MSDDVALRVAAGLLWFTGLGFGLPCLWGIWQLRATGQVPTLFGFPSYGGGPFERHGIHTTVRGFISSLLSFRSGVEESRDGLPEIHHPDRFSR